MPLLIVQVGDILDELFRNNLTKSSFGLNSAIANTEVFSQIFGKIKETVYRYIEKNQI